MYKVAYSKARENPKLEPTAICNYATFLFKVRKNPEAAQVMFADGINRYWLHSLL